MDSNLNSNLVKDDFSIIKIETITEEKPLSNDLKNLPNNNNKNEWQSSTDLDFLFASRLVKDARDLRNLSFKKTKSHLKAYEIYLDYRFTLFIKLVYLVNILLPIIEEPSIFKNISYWVSCSIELICLIIYLFRWIHAKWFQVKDEFNNDIKNYVVLASIFLLLADIVQFVVLKSLGIKFCHRYFRLLRVFIYINSNEGKELRRAFRNVRKTLPDILNVFALFFFSILIFGFVGWQLFRKKGMVYANNLSYFQNYEDSIWDLYISVTTANFPDVMMPAYDLNGAYSIFFIIFMLVNLFVFINIILATIYSNYKKHLKAEVTSTIQLKLMKSKDAFDLIKLPFYSINADKNEKTEFKETEFLKTSTQHVITYDRFLKLMKLIDPNKKENQIKIFFELLDSDENGLITYKEFIYLADLLNIKVTEIKDRQNMFEKFIPKVYNSKYSLIIKKLVRHEIFQLFFILLIGVNIIFVVTNNKDEQNGGKYLGLEWFFLSAFLIEIILKIYSFGFIGFVSDYWNIFDAVVIFSGLIAGIVDEVNPNNEGGQIFEVVLILRSLRLIKFLASINRFRAIITTIAIILPSLLTYAMLLLTIYYVFSMIGMEIFGDVIQTQYQNNDTVYDCFNSKLRDTDFTRYKYCKNNFSSFPNSLVLLFELMVVNQWQILSRGFEDAIGTKWTRLYFLAFHIICVIILLNIFTAFVIEAFMLEYESHNKDNKSNLNKIESRINNLNLSYNLSNGEEDTNFKQINDDLDDSKSIDKKEIAKKSSAIRFKFFLNRFFGSLKNIFVNSSINNLDSSVNKINNNNNNDSTTIGGIKFHINTREAKPVEILLQTMFSNELDISNDDFFNI